MHSDRSNLNQRVLRTILTIYAHPDDESFGPAAALAKYAQQGAAFYGVFFTRGENGESVLEPAPSPSELARLRNIDLQEAAALIGYSGIEVLPYVDGGLADVPEGELAARVLESIRRYQPGVVLTFGPGGISGHADHIALSRAVTAAFHQARAEGLPVRELLYNAVSPERARERGLENQPDGQPNLFVEVSETQSIKLAALKKHARTMADAVQIVARLEGEPQTAALFHRAWPPVPDGVALTGFFSDGA